MTDTDKKGVKVNGCDERGPTLAELVYELIENSNEMTRLKTEATLARNAHGALVQELMVDREIPETSVIEYKGKTYLIEADIEEARYIHVKQIENLDKGE